MIPFLSWFFIIFILGWAGAPLAYRMFPTLADRGFFFSKILGLLLLGFFFWLLVITGILRNDNGGILICFGLILTLSFLSLRNGGFKDWLAWIKTHKIIVISGEVLFLIAFGAMALLRAANPEIIGTEKPMELAFINSILRSPTFPPHDPWLSGYAISYYYFGYVMSAILIKLSGVSSGIGFNLSISLWFALTALGAYGVLFSLLNFIPVQKEKDTDKTAARKPGFLAALLAPLFILILGNLEGLLEILHSAGLFWNKTGGQLTSGFWQYLNVAELTQPPLEPFSLIPNRVSGIWWWRASRVLQDFDLQGNVKEIIDEFPFFSYLLADLHPHVLAVPFVLMAIAFSLNFYLTFRGMKSPSIGFFAWFSKVAGGKGTEDTPVEKSFITRPDFWIGAVIFGGLSFLNTWDFPIYVALFCAVFVLVKIQVEGWHRRFILEFIETGLALGLAGVLLYLPFYIGFSSQAGGLLPSLAFFTRGVYFWLMFGIMLTPIFIWLFTSRSYSFRISNWVFGFKFSAALVFGLWLVSYGLAVSMGSLVAWASLTAADGDLQSALANRIVDLNNLFSGLQGGGLGSSLISASLVQRLAAPGTWLTLLILLTLVFGLLRALLDKGQANHPTSEIPPENASEEAFHKAVTPFVLILILVGAGLTLLPEFFYLRDQFGWRMNTIFKFYYQTWILWSLVGAYATIRIWKTANTPLRMLGCVLCLLLVIGGLVYPVFGARTKTNDFNPGEFTLDGNAYMTRYAPGEVSAIEFLRTAPAGVVSEAIGGSYSSSARVSTLSGQPTVLGWPGHESQWRGGSKEMGSREADIELLYQTTDWPEALEVLRRYQIRYVYVGGLERSEYRINENKFISYLTPVFRNEEATIYEVPASLLK
jgi:YYY domain-containing protein